MMGFEGVSPPLAVRFSVRTVILLASGIAQILTASEDELAIGVASIRHHGTSIPDQTLNRTYLPTENAWYNLSLTHLRAETRNALKTYSLLSTIKPYDYDLLFVEFGDGTSTTTTLYSTAPTNSSRLLCTHHRTNDEPQGFGALSSAHTTQTCGFVCLPTPDQGGESTLGKHWSAGLPFPQIPATTPDNPMFPRLSDLVSDLIFVLEGVGWEEMVIFYDVLHAPLADVLASRLTQNHKGLMIFHMRDAQNWSLDADSFGERDAVQNKTLRGSVDDLLREMYLQLSKNQNLHVLLLCSLDNVKAVLSRADGFDRSHNKSTALHMRSQWMVLAVGEETADRAGCYLESLRELDNVALLSSVGESAIKVSAIDRVQSAITAAVENAELANVTLGKDELQEFLTQRFLAECAPSAQLWIHSLYYGKQRTRYFNAVAMVTDGSARQTVNKRAIFPNTKFGLNNRSLILSGVEWPNFLTRIQIGNMTTYDGVLKRIFRRLQRVLNFTVVFTEPSAACVAEDADCATGYEGIIGQLQRREVDMAVPIFITNPYGSDVYDITCSFHHEGVAVIFRKPHPDEEKWLTLIKPFRWQVHMMLFVAIAVYGLLTAVMERFNPYYKRTHSSLHSGVDSIQYMFGAVLNQGGSRLPSSCTGRVLVSFWWLFSIIIASTYGGNLIAFLTVSRENLPFADLKGLISQDRYRWGFPAGMVAKDITKHNPVWEAVYSQAVAWNSTTPDVMSENMSKHWDLVRDGQYAFIGPASTAKAWTQKDCTLASFLLDDVASPTAIGLPKGSPYTDLISHVLSMTKEAGLIQHWVSRKLLHTTAFCEGSLIAEARAISLLDVQSVFYASAIGIVLSSLLLGGEILLKRTTSGRQVWFLNRRAGGKAAATGNSSGNRTSATAPRASAAAGAAAGAPVNAGDSLGTWLCQTFNPCRRRRRRKSSSGGTVTVSAHKAPSWPKADTRSVWSYNTSFRRSGEELARYGETRVCGGEYALSKHAISVIASTRKDLRPATVTVVGRSNSISDLRRLSSQLAGPVEGHRAQVRLSVSAVQQPNPMLTDGCFNGCFCNSESDTSGDEAAERRSDEEGNSCDSGVDRCSIASTRFGDNESELW